MKILPNLTLNLGTILVLINALLNIPSPRMAQVAPSQKPEPSKVSFSLVAPALAQVEEEEVNFVSLTPFCERKPKGYHELDGNCFYCYGQKLGNSWGYQTQLTQFCRLFNGHNDLVATPTPLPWPTPTPSVS